MAGGAQPREPGRSRRRPRDGSGGYAAARGRNRARRRGGAAPRGHSPSTSVRSGTRVRAPGRRGADRPKSARRAPAPEHSVCSRSIPSPGVNSCQHVGQILAKLIPRAVAGLPTGDKHVVATGDRELRKQAVCQGDEATPRPVPLHRVPHLATRRKPHAHHRAQSVRGGLQHEPRCGAAPAPAAQPQEVLPIPKPRKRTFHPVMRSASCGPWRVGWPAPGGLPWSPCGRETRAVSCAQADSVGTCVS